MDKSQDGPGSAATLPETDRRALRGRLGLATLLRRLRGLLKRPLRVERQGWQWQLTLVERRRSRQPFRPGSELRLVAELEACLLSIDGEKAAAAMRQLMRVHEALQRRGWGAVEAMSARDLGRAATQCDLLAGVASSAPLAGLAERLRLLKVGAELREERRSRAQRAATEATTVIAEVSYDDYCEQVRRQKHGVPARPADSQLERDPV